MELGMAMKTLTGSRKVINILNRLGHSISYSAVEELETELTYSSCGENFTTPYGIQQEPNLATGVAFDNFDRFVETLSGKDTLHDTVGIIYQNKNITEDVEEIDVNDNPRTSLLSTTSQRKRRRMFDILDTDIEPYRKKPKLQEVSEFPSLSMSRNKYKFIQRLDNIWLILLAITDTEIPMWTGWNNLQLDSSTLPMPIQNVSYLPPINESPTNMSVVAHTLNLAQNIAHECQQPYISVTYDLAIAKMTMQIQSEERPKYNNIFIQLGAFHIQIFFFKAVGKYIEESGGPYILAESGVLASGSLKGFITGTYYNRCKRIHPIWILRLYANLANVENTHPGLKETLIGGGISIRRTEKSFSGTPIDLTLEQTINADAANKLTGITSFTNSISARRRWAASHSLRTSSVTNLLENLKLTSAEDVSNDLRNHRIEKDNAFLQEMVNHISTTLNPFLSAISDHNQLLNLATGKAATECTKNFLLNIVSMGEKLRDKFVAECREDASRFEKPIPKQKIQSFALQNKVKVCRRRVNAFYETLVETVAKALPAYHALTGSDYTASFARKGKTRFLRLIENCLRTAEVFGTFGSSKTISDEQVDCVEMFICKMYGRHKIKSVNEDILFLHVVSGCDTTSNPFGVGKKKVLSIYEKNHFLSDIVSVFKDEDATPRQLSVAGEKFVVALYGGNIDTDTVNDLRYRIFSNSVAKSRFHLARLLPTRDAAQYHSLRTHIQVQTWLGNKKSPSVWRWTLTKRWLIPITTTTDAAPEKLLHMIQCKCMTGCSTGACNCKKAGLRCSAICKNCAGNACENSPETELNEEDTDIECDEEVVMDETIAQDEDADLPTK
ncbi:unnamed protein product [Phaedon cochleariae]|uniref:Tesmin/TSO1-like CXC domain-containing protein n=1 Tax=Phaedon cochleariae TaxID=80249 RepID=A0A9N9SGP6_PHACE|nr:unnamed protein product [Phaedon cochleariae]